jgi:prolyl-tRNA editing enzyme YbaK/EbsC (Cys-tRNA(Pro) deacylase)
MRYCYTEAGKAEITLEMTVADLQELLAAVNSAAACRKFKLSDPPLVA